MYVVSAWYFEPSMNAYVEKNRGAFDEIDRARLFFKEIKMDAAVADLFDARTVSMVTVVQTSTADSPKTMQVIMMGDKNGKKQG